MHDPVLIEIIKNAMATIAEEIGIVAVRSAYSTVVKESADASAAVCDLPGPGHRAIARRSAHASVQPALVAAQNYDERFPARDHEGGRRLPVQ